MIVHKFGGKDWIFQKLRQNGWLEAIEYHRLLFTIITLEKFGRLPFMIGDRDSAPSIPSIPRAASGKV
jgi:hypothetical protein